MVRKIPFVVVFIFSTFALGVISADNGPVWHTEQLSGFIFTKVHRLGGWEPYTHPEQFPTLCQIFEHKDGTFLLMATRRIASRFAIEEATIAVPDSRGSVEFSTHVVLTSEDADAPAADIHAKPFFKVDCLTRKSGLPPKILLLLPHYEYYLKFSMVMRKAGFFY